MPILRLPFQQLTIDLKSQIGARKGEKKLRADFHEGGSIAS